MAYQTALFNAQGDRIRDDLDLPDGIFSIVPNTHEMHRALVRQLANQRAGTHSTLTRSEVSGGGKKPWRQKGTGRARVGSTRSPLWRTGGVVFGPKPRSYETDLPRKIRRLALRSALATRKDSIVVVENWAISAPKTKEVLTILAKMGLDGRILLITHEQDEALSKSVRNVPRLKVILATNLNVKDLLGSDKIVTTQAALDQIAEVFAK